MVVRSAPPRDASAARAPRFAIAALHLLGLTMLAVAQPLYDVLGRYPTFFVAHAAGPGAIVAFAIALAIGPPLALLAVAAAARLFGRRVWWAVHLLLIAGVVGLLVLPPLHRAVALPPLVALGAAGLVAGLAAAGYARVGGVRAACTLLGLAAPLLPLIFLFATPVAGLLRPAGVAGVPAAPAARPLPVVMVVFDELSLYALLDDAGDIDAARFPHFAALARTSTWYRNATTVADYTPLAMPALLSGRLPDHNRIPVAAEHPDTLFSLLAASHRLEVVEPVTALCAAGACRDAAAPAGDAPPATLPRAFLYGDAIVVWLHMLAPPAWRARLPDIGRQWTFRFQGWLVEHLAAPVRRDRVAAFTAFVDALQPRREPTLWFAHVLLPHSPYEYLPSGTRYEAPPADFHRQRFDPQRPERHAGWPADRAAGAAQEQQRYLLQVALVDTLLGRLLARLDASGLGDEALLIVTADHGVSLRPGTRQRFVDAANAPDILWVPLFVRQPGQRQGRIDDRNVQTIDVLPTVADALGVAVPWRVDGASLLDPAAPRPGEKIAFTPVSLANQLDLTRLVLPPERPRDPPAQRAQARLFPPGRPAAALFAHGPFPDLLGARLDAVAPGAPLAVRAHLADAARYRDVRPASGAVPSFVRGHLEPRDALAAPPALAIAVDGVVAATTQAFVADDGRLTFGALLPEHAWRAGENRVEVLVVTASDGSARLTPLPTR